MNAQLLNTLVSVGPLLSAVVVLLTVLTSAHAILHKREVHASISWVVFIWLAPLVGALAYLMFGRNRIRRRAARLRQGAPGVAPGPPVEPFDVQKLGVPRLEELARLVGNMTGLSLHGGNAVVPLVDGDAAYPAMLEAIAGARHSIGLMCYIFERKGPGARFVDALAAAVERGVQVRVLLDDVGTRYGFPPVTRPLRDRGVPVARFLPAHKAASFNLRNHRKLLVVDGTRAYTGGLNIRPGHVLADRPRRPTRDLHFAVAGPVVAQLVRVFALDWSFTTGEVLEGDCWFPELAAAGTVAARVVPDGPDEDLDKIRWAFLGGIACAQRSVRILTPYFLPDTALATALNVAAMRGVRVDIVVPERGNLPVVQWAMWATFSKVLGHRCRVWLNGGVFDHSKVMVVDEHWTFLGSPNWDARSLRLNFELGVECYDQGLARAMCEYVDARIAGASEVTLEMLRGRALARRLRDGVARLLTPYL